MTARRPPGGARSGKPRRGRDRDNRGQAHTLEGVTAGLIILSAVVFALEMTAVTPLSASTSSQHIENQQEATARGVLASAAETGALERALLSWNATSKQFYETPQVGYFTTGAPPNDFGTTLERSFDRQGIAYNVYLRYQGADGEIRVQRYVHQGQPSDHAVRATWALSLMESDEIRDENGDPTGTAVSDESTYFAPRQSSASVYNVINVEVVVWRI
ncbi:DUF7288 family protein [Halosimplex sp. J119]